MLTGSLGGKEHSRHETMIYEATLESLSEHRDSCKPEKDTNADGDMS